MDTSFHSSRFLVGIDLGTTNSTVSYIDRNSGKPSEIHLFPIRQVVAAGEVHERPVLPSFYFLPPEVEISQGILELQGKKKAGGIAGTYAREHGASLPDRFIFSAKSWLAHSGVDRKAPILPWGSGLTDRKLSPVAVSKHYISHIIDEWDRKFGELKDSEGTPCRLREQQVVLTVPASFDEAARELTVEAATEAGLKHLTLIEEPMAAFYSWLAKNRDWNRLISAGETVLVIDIGGGTTDFSIISMEKGDTLRRTAVGNHLLLGGDNIDIAIAKTLEKKWKRTIGAKEWGALCQVCRQAKERLFLDDSLTETPVSLHLGGSSVVASTLVSTLKKDEVLAIIMSGFFPETAVDSPPLKKRAGLRNMGLPYESDPAVTKHLLGFLKLVNVGNGEDRTPLIPDKILFNGGSMLPKIIRKRVLDVVNSWSSSKTVSELVAWNLDLAVSTGAAYHALVKLGFGKKVYGGISRAYYIEVQDRPAARLICIMPRDTDEGEVQSLSRHRFKVRTNEQVRFSISGSATRLHDTLGEVIDESDEITPLPPLQTVIKFGKNEARLVDVSLSTHLNSTGTLEIWLNSTTTDHRWQLRFDLRAMLNKSDDKETASNVNRDESVTVTEKQFDLARKIIDNCFADPETLSAVVRNLEGCFEVKRESWPLALIRRVFDFLLEIKEISKRSFQHEARWLNLAGYTLRPGFGDSTDVWRIKQLWPLWLSGPCHPQNGQVSAEWWVMWRRVSGGLSKGRQEQIGSALLKYLCSKKKGRRKTAGMQEEREMWRCLGSLELLQPREKVKAAQYIFSNYTRPDKSQNWALGRMGARNLVYGPADLVTPAKETEMWVEEIIKRAKKADDESVHFALGHIAEYSGEKTLDLKDSLRERVESYLKEGEAAEAFTRRLWERITTTEKEDEKIMGDSLPIGLHLHGDTSVAEEVTG